MMRLGGLKFLTVVGAALLLGACAEEAGGPTPGDEITEVSETTGGQGGQDGAGEDALAPGDDGVGEDAVEPGDDGVGEDAVEPGEDSVEPGEDSVEPGEDGVEPGEDTVEPGEDTVEPGEDTVEPGEDTVEPGEDTVEPGEDTVEPGEDTVEPGEDTVTPAHWEPIPNDAGICFRGVDCGNPERLTCNADVPGGRCVGCGVDAHCPRGTECATGGCAPTCSSSEPCPSGLRCHLTQGICVLDACQADSDCPDPYVCTALSAGGTAYCRRQACTETDECAEGSSCYLGYCMEEAYRAQP